MPRIHRTEAETRALVADAVIDHVSRNGLGVDPELPMERILAQAGVSRASAYRIWPGRSAFSAFALEQCAAGHAVDTLDPQRARMLAEEALATEEDRLLSATRFVTTAADEELSVMLRSDHLRAFVAFHATAITTQSPEISQMLTRIDQQDASRLATFYDSVAQAWALEVVDDISIDSVASAASLISRSTVARVVSGGDAAQVRKTYLTALAALLRGSFRVRPDTVADLRRFPHF